MNKKYKENGVELRTEGGINLRDLGGYATSNGRIVRRGVLFRSGELSDLTEKDRAFLASLPVGTVLDYRDEGEAQASPDPEWAGVTILREPASNDILRARGLSGDVRQMVRSMPDTFDGEALMRDLYRELPFNNPAYRRLFALLADEGRGGLLQHCTAGKDRTGVGSALTLLALGVPVETVRQDYLRTGECLGEDFARRLFRRMGGEALPPGTLQKLLPMAEVRREYLDGTFDAIRERCGDFDAFFEKEFGLDEHGREALRAIYTESK